MEIIVSSLLNIFQLRISTQFTKTSDYIPQRSLKGKGTLFIEIKNFTMRKNIYIWQILEMLGKKVLQSYLVEHFKSVSFYTLFIWLPIMCFLVCLNCGVER